MSENNELQPETNQEPKSDHEPNLKDQIKMELKEEFKQKFVHHKRKKLRFFLKLLIVFLLGLGIGFFAGHHDHGYRYAGYKMHGGHQMKMQHDAHMGNPNPARGE